MKIIVDAFGGDNAPLEVIKGCVQAVNEFNINIILVGSKKKIEKVCKENEIILYKIDIADADEVVTMEDSPQAVMKSKGQNSMAEGLRLLHQGAGDAFVTAGNSGALVFGSTLIVKRIRGIKRCAFAPILPCANGKNFMLIDSGANVECRPEMLQQFGLMASVYMKKVMKINSPKVALANVGVEEHKGGPFQRESFEKLKKMPINFIGNIEAREIMSGKADVIVTDGFTGNIILKLCEGVASVLMGKIKNILTKNTKNKLVAAVLLPDIKILKKEMDYNEYGGAPVLGISKPVFKVHGNANAYTIAKAIKLTVDYIKTNVIGEILQVVSNQRNLNFEEVENAVD